MGMGKSRKGRVKRRMLEKRFKGTGGFPVMRRKEEDENISFWLLARTCWTREIGAMTAIFATLPYVQDVVDTRINGELPDIFFGCFN